MSAPYATLFRCTVGGADFQLEDYGVEVQPVVELNLGRTNTIIRVSGKGWIEASSAADLAAKILAAQAALNTAGQDFRVYGLSDVEEYSILAATCLDGGPHVGFSIQPQMDAGLLRKRFTFTVEARTGAVPFTPIPPASTYKQEVTVGPDGLRRITRTGQITQSAASAYFTSTVLPAFRSTYSPPNWAALTYRVSTDANDGSLTYSISADELRMPFITGASAIVDGEGVYTRRRDEQHRLTEVWDFDFVLSSGDYQPVLDLIRAGIAEPNLPIVRESVNVTLHRQTRMRATFEQLRGGDGNELLHWQQGIDLDDSGFTWEEKRYPGVDPILVKQPYAALRLTQSGVAIGAGKQIIEPDPLFDDCFAEPPKISYRQISDFEFETRWTYVMVVFDPDLTINAALLLKLRRPSQPAIM